MSFWRFLGWQLLTWRYHGNIDFVVSNSKMVNSVQLRIAVEIQINNLISNISIKRKQWESKECESKEYLVLNKRLRPATLLKKRLWHRCFPVNLVKFLRTPFLIEHQWWLLLKIVSWKSLTIYTKNFLLDVLLGSEYASEATFNAWFYLIKFEFLRNDKRNLPRIRFSVSDTYEVIRIYLMEVWSLIMVTCFVYVHENKFNNSLLFLLIYVAFY